MRETKRSPEHAIDPKTGDYVWCRCGDAIRCDDAVCGNCHDPTHPTDERTRRVDACLAACAGLSTEALESGALGRLFDALNGWCDADNTAAQDAESVERLNRAWIPDLGRLE